MFPDHADDIEAKVDPGEYGVESAACRVVCCILFVFIVMGDFYRAVGLARLLRALPSKDESWVYFKDAYNEQVGFRIRGLPLVWKVVNAIVIVVPQLVLWKAVAYIGSIWRRTMVCQKYGFSS